VTRSVVVTNRGAPRRPASNVRKRKRRAARRVGVVRRESATRLTPAPAGDAGARRLATPTAVRRDGLPRAAGDARVCQTAEAGSPVSGSLRRRSCSGRSSRSTTGVAQEVAPRVLGRVRRRTGVGTSRSCGSPPSGTGRLERPSDGLGAWVRQPRATRKRVVRRVERLPAAPVAVTTTRGPVAALARRAGT
jgi:hypothetical protein